MIEKLFTLIAGGQVNPDDIGIPQVEGNSATLASAASAVFVVVGALAVLFVLVGAARYVAANGEQAKIAQAKNTILFALIGVVVSLLGFTVVQFVIGVLVGGI